jgi:hypothetical protein
MAKYIPTVAPMYGTTEEIRSVKLRRRLGAAYAARDARHDFESWGWSPTPSDGSARSSCSGGDSVIKATLPFPAVEADRDQSTAR